MGKIYGVTNACDMQVLHLQLNRLQDFQLNTFHIQTSVICGIGQIIGDGGVMGRAYLGLFFL